MEAILALEDGTVLKGRGIGKPGITTGELVFNTSMTGYQEVITDPSYHKQIVVFTYPHIGNTGINLEDNESSNPYCSGIIACNIQKRPSHWQAKLSLPEYLQSNNLPAIEGIDTRLLTKKLRNSGAMRACIMLGSVDANKAIEAAKTCKSLLAQNLADEVSTKEAYTVESSANNSTKVVVLDFGVKESIIDKLKTLGCTVCVLPSTSTFDDIVAKNPDAVILSNGPGDPGAVETGANLAKSLIRTGMPLLGICLGFQILALALGAKTQKMKFGHHGINHPIQDVDNKRVLITSQNHGFAVDMDSLPSTIKVTHVSLFDGTLQGFCHKDKLVYAYQGHPESGPGPTDANILINNFIEKVSALKKVSLKDVELVK